MRPARPARWIADAWLTLLTASTGKPLHGECEAMRASPESMTATTPSMVTEVLGHVGRKNHLPAICGLHRPSLFRGRQITVQRQQQEVACLGQRRQFLAGAAYLGRAGKEDQHVAGKPLLAQPAHGARDLIGQRSRVGLGQCSRAISNSRPSLRTSGQSPRNRTPAPLPASPT